MSEKYQSSKVLRQSLLLLSKPASHGITLSSSESLSSKAVQLLQSFLGVVIYYLLASWLILTRPAVGVSSIAGVALVLSACCVFVVALSLPLLSSKVFACKLENVFHYSSWLGRLCVHFAFWISASSGSTDAEIGQPPDGRIGPRSWLTIKCGSRTIMSFMVCLVVSSVAFASLLTAACYLCGVIVPDRVFVPALVLGVTVGGFVASLTSWVVWYSVCVTYVREIEGICSYCGHEYEPGDVVSTCSECGRVRVLDR